MIFPPKHEKEAERLEALRNSSILDTDPEQEYDDITLLASYITGSPVSMISLVDAERQWFKSKVGLDFNETPRDHAFCAHAIHETDIFEVEDAEKDERFHDNPLVTDQKLKFYAGTQLRNDDGLPLGTLCVMDDKPRKLSDEERKALDALGRQVLAQFKLREKNEEVSRELNVAKNIQQSMLPSDFVPNQTNTKLKLEASMNCAKEVGGDIYDYFYIDDKHLALVLGDVSGKGVPAAMYMAMSKTLIRSNAKTSDSPAQCISRVNNELAKESISNMFITLFFGVLNVETGELEIVNGGHNLPVVLRNDGTVEELKMDSQLILGVAEDFPYESEKIKLEKGDSILIYTDGVTEAFDKDENEYGEERLLKFCEAHKEKSLKEFTESLVFDVYKYSEGMPQSDDITMLMAKFDK